MKDGGTARDRRWLDGELMGLDNENVSLRSWIPRLFRGWILPLPTDIFLGLWTERP